MVCVTGSSTLDFAGEAVQGQRHIDLDGQPSFRDIGGYKTAGGIISVGDSTGDVLAKCSAPTHEDESVRIETTKKSHGDKFQVEIRRKTLIYDLGPEKLIREVIIENGKVVEINSKGYGSAN